MSNINRLLRVYEKEGLILSERTPTDQCMCSDLEIEKVRRIRRMISDQAMVDCNTIKDLIYG